MERISLGVVVHVALELLAGVAFLTTNIQAYYRETPVW